MSKVNHDEIKSRLQSAIKKLLEEANLSERDVPNMGVYQSDGSFSIYGESSGDYCVSRPSGAIKPEDIIEADYFQEFSLWLLNSGNGYVSPKFDSDGNLREKPDPEEAPTKYLRETMYFVENYFDYVGKFEFDEDAFEVAYENEFETNYEAVSEQIIITPIHNLEVKTNELSLKYGSRFENVIRGGFNIKKISIGRLSEEEKTALFTKENGPFRIGSSKVEVVIEDNQSDIGVSPHPLDVFDIPEIVINGLRLFSPESGIEPSYNYEITYDSWWSYQADLPEIRISQYPPRVSKTGNLSKEKTSAFDQSDLNDFSDFWEEYHENFLMKSDTIVSDPMRRMNEMYYVKGKPEDHFLDSMIGFEETILKGIRGSYRFWFPLRACLILTDEVDYSVEFIYDFFEPIYGIRSRIVHSDGEMNHPFMKESDLEKADINRICREFLAASIRYYMKVEEESNENIQEHNESLNEDIYELLRKSVKYNIGD